MKFLLAAVFCCFAVVSNAATISPSSPIRLTFDFGGFETIRDISFFHDFSITTQPTQILTAVVTSGSNSWEYQGSPSGVGVAGITVLPTFGIPRLTSGFLDVFLNEGTFPLRAINIRVDSGFRSVDFSNPTTPPAVPLPAGFPLLIAGLASIGFVGRLRKPRRQ